MLGRELANRLLALLLQRQALGFQRHGLLQNEIGFLGQVGRTLFEPKLVKDCLRLINFLLDLG